MLRALAEDEARHASEAEPLWARLGARPALRRLAAGGGALIGHATGLLGWRIARGLDVWLERRGIAVYRELEGLLDATDAERVRDLRQQEETHVERILAA